MIKLYPDGKFSSLLADGGLKAGDEVEVTGPYGVFTLREKSERPLLFIGGGAGMAPILALLRSMAETGNERPAVYYYGARGPADLFHLDELAGLERRLPNFRFVPALSHCDEDDGLERRARASSPMSSAAWRRSWRRWTPTCAGRHRWSTPPSPCWISRASPSHGSTTTSSRPPRPESREERGNDGNRH